MSLKCDAILAILGGFLVHLVLGSFYLWPNVIVYITSYFRLNGNPDLTISTANFVFPAMIICQSIAMPFGKKIGLRIGFRNELLLGVGILSTAVFTSSFMTNFWIFIIFYGFIFGLVNGACYIVPINIGLGYLPHWGGKVSGMIVCGFGMGAFFLSYIAQYLMNPDNLTPSIHNK